jgi:hypothetical protein
VQELLDAFLIANDGRHGDRVFRSPGEQAPNHHELVFGWTDATGREPHDTSYTRRSPR